MKIAICGSIFFMRQMIEAQKALESLGHEVKTPPLETEGDDGTVLGAERYYAKRKAARDEDVQFWKNKHDAILAHFDKIKWADAILVLNYEKNEIAGYIGGNTFLEIGIAFEYRKMIFLDQSIPQQGIREELLAMFPVVIDGDYSKIKNKGDLPCSSK